MYKKPVIVFEGIEGSGKTFHSKFVCKYLRKKKIPFINLREPGGSNNSEKIRNLILNKKNNFDKFTDLLLYFASRSENMIKLRKEYKKKIIIIDRFVDSTIAYQHFGQGVDIKTINFINNQLLKNFKINLTFLNIVNIDNMILRLKKRKKLNRYDQFDINFYKRVQNGFLKIAKKNSKDYKIIDSNLSIQSNKKTIIDIVKKLIN